MPHLHGAPMYIFRVAKNSAFEPQHALLLISMLIKMGPVAFQIVARPEGIRWQAVDLSGRNYSLSTLQSPQVEVERVRYNARKERNYPLYRAKISYQSTHSATHPLPMIEDFRAAGDPLLYLARSLSYLRQGEEVRYTVLVEGLDKPFRYHALEMVDIVLKSTDLASQLSSHDQIIRHKHQQEWYATFIGLDVDAPNPYRAFELRHALDLQLSGIFSRQQMNQPANGLLANGYPDVFPIRNSHDFIHTDTLGWYLMQFQNNDLREWWQSRWLYLTRAEIAALWHLPHEAFQGSEILWRQHRPAVPYRVAVNTEGIIIGQGYYQDRLVPVRLNAIDRDIHQAFVGATGTGKSTAMLEQIIQDIAAGHCVFVLDPHGSLVDNILLRGIPPEREQDVVLLDLGDPQYPIPLNLFAGKQTYAAVGRVVNTIDKFIGGTGVQIDKFLRAGIKALQKQPNPTMVDFFKLYTDEGYRRIILEQVTDLETYQTLYHDYHVLSPAKQSGIRGPLLNRISPFISNDYLYPSLCHPDRIDFEDFIHQRKIVLATLNVDRESVPEDERNLVGALMISMLQMVSMKQPIDGPRFYAYIDEVQNFIGTSLGNVFSEARKFGLSLAVAHQHFSQLEQDFLNSILAAVGTLVVFRTYSRDAEKLAAELGPEFAVEDIINLDRFNAAVKMQLNQKTERPFLLVGRKPPKLTQADRARAAYLRQLARKNHTPKTRDEVLKQLHERYGSMEPIREELKKHGRFLQDVEAPVEVNHEDFKD